MDYKDLNPPNCDPGPISVGAFRRFMRQKLLMSETALRIGEPELIDVHAPDGTVSKVKVRGRVRFSNAFDAAQAVMVRTLESEDVLGNPTPEASKMARWLLDQCLPSRRTTSLTQNNNTTNVMAMAQIGAPIEPTSVDLANAIALRALESTKREESE